MMTRLGRCAPRVVRGRACSAALIAFAFAWSERADAGGFYFADRGVRPLGRAGAFVAGADDVGAVAYNPAGLAFAGHQLLLDAAWIDYHATFQRQAFLEQTDPTTGEPTGVNFIQTFDPVDGSTPFLPIPTFAYSNPFGLDDWNFALAVWAPYAAATTWPRNVGGSPAPQRYSLISLGGSALAVLGAYAAFEPADAIAIGAGVELLGGKFDTEVAFSACVPDRFICAPEEPDYDAYTKLSVGPIVAPSGVIGVTAIPSREFRAGASFRLPTRVSSGATVKVRLPSAPVFDSARQAGDDAHVTFDLPWTLRLGAEVRPSDVTRAEVSFAYEAWSMHDEIIVENENITLHDVQAFPPAYRIGTTTLPRGFRDAWSVHLGGEQGFTVSETSQIEARAGVSYERGAIPDEFLSSSTVDLDKVTAALGGSAHVGALRFDLVLARIFGFTTTSDPEKAAIAPVNPIDATPPLNATAVNGGRYEAFANVVGLGVAYTFDPPDGE